MAGQRVDPVKLMDLLKRILQSAGCEAEEAGLVADHLVDASMRGHDSHGVVRILRYVQWLHAGQINANRQIRIISDMGSMIHLDGQSGMGQRLARDAVALGIERAGLHGMAMIAMRRAGHIGRLGAYAEQICSAGFVSVQFANVGGSRIVAPFGSAEASCSTAPIAIGVPNPDGDDFILDFATSIVAEGKALVAARGGKAIPDDAIISGGGERSGDPRELYGDTISTSVPDPRAGAGALRTMGDHKGSGLALACELLAGAMTGNGTNGPGDAVFGNGHVIIIVDPKRLDDQQGFGAAVGEYIAHVQGSRPEAGVDQVLIPGDPERLRLADALSNGLIVPAAVLDGITGLAGEMQLEFADLKK